jgi:hypothetical protein
MTASDWFLALAFVALLLSMLNEDVALLAYGLAFVFASAVSAMFA